MGPLVELDCFHKSHALVLKNFNFTSSITLSVENLSLDVGLVVCSGDSGAVKNLGGHIAIEGTDA